MTPITPLYHDVLGNIKTWVT